VRQNGINGKITSRIEPEKKKLQSNIYT